MPLSSPKPAGHPPTTVTCGAGGSYWLTTTADAPAYGRSLPETVDVAVVGGVLERKLELRALAMDELAVVHQAQARVPLRGAVVDRAETLDHRAGFRQGF